MSTIHKITIGETEYPLEHKLMAQSIADGYLRNLGKTLNQAIIRVASAIETKMKVDAEMSGDGGKDTEKNKSKVFNSIVALYAQFDYESVFHVLWSLMINKENYGWLDYPRFKGLMFDLDMEKYPYNKLAEICLDTIKASLPKQVQDALKPGTGKSGEKKK